MSAALPAWKLRRGVVLRSRATRGDSEAFAALYERHHQALYRYCRSILHHEEDARDALQSTMVKAFAALQREERDFDLRPWLFRIAHNEAVTLLRRRRDAVSLDLAATVGNDSLPGEIEQRERLGRLREDLADLPLRQRSALVLRELNGLGHEEIAQVLGSTPRAVKQTIFEARSSLGECEEGREMACAEIQRMLSDADGRVLRGRRVRSHLRSCRSCRQFKTALAQRPADLALLAPPLSAAAAAAVASAVGGAALTGAGGAAGASAGGTAITTKLVALAAATATAAGGVAATEVVRHHKAPDKSHQTDRGPGHANAPASQPGRTDQSVLIRASRPRVEQAAFDKPARRGSTPVAEARAPGRASSPSHVSRPVRARGGGRPDRPAPPAGRQKPTQVKPVKTPPPGHTRPMPPESNGLAKGHDKPPSQQGPKDKPLSAVQPVETVVAETIPPGQATAPGQAKR